MTPQSKFGAFFISLSFFFYLFLFYISLDKRMSFSCLRTKINFLFVQFRGKNYHIELKQRKTIALNMFMKMLEVPNIFLTRFSY